MPEFVPGKERVRSRIFFFDKVKWTNCTYFLLIYFPFISSVFEMFFTQGPTKQWVQLDPLDEKTSEVEAISFSRKNTPKTRKGSGFPGNLYSFYTFSSWFGRKHVLSPPRTKKIGFLLFSYLKLPCRISASGPAGRWSAKGRRWRQIWK